MFWIVKLGVNVSPGRTDAGSAPGVSTRIGTRSAVSDCTEIAPYAFVFASVHVSEPTKVSFLLSNVARRARYAASVSPAAFSGTAATLLDVVIDVVAPAASPGSDCAPVVASGKVISRCPACDAADPTF